MLEARSLTLAWNSSRTIAQRLSFDLKRGETLCIVGRSGTGKTTLLHTLAGLVRPQAGSILLEGRDITGCPGHVSYMLQKDLLLPSERIIDNVCMPLTLKGTSKEDAYRYAEPLFERFGLSGTERLWPRELSGGMRQRAAFMRTYLMGAKVMLLDEPFSALDAITRQELRDWFSNVSRELELSSIIITHDVDEAISCANRVLVLAGAPSQGTPSCFVCELEIDTRDDAHAAQLRREILNLL